LERLSQLQKLVADESYQVLMLGRAQHFESARQAPGIQHFQSVKGAGRVFDVLVDTDNEIRPG